jgi:hypothetical protein
MISVVEDFLRLTGHSETAGLVFLMLLRFESALAYQFSIP